MQMYQSFPNESGSSKSFEKLISLNLPQIKDKKVLDIGCNSGFFCGFADFHSAKLVDGIDIDSAFLIDARKRFPNVNFIETSFEKLPNRKYDLIFLLSAIHYSTDQPELIHRIMSKHLDAEGLLVLEMGIIVNDEPPNWTLIERGIDKRLFANQAMLAEILSSYAWKIVSESIPQSGDPIERFVIHVRKKKKFAALMLGAPGSGKSTIAENLFSPNTLIVNLDKVLYEIYLDQKLTSRALKKTIKTYFSHFDLQITYNMICSGGLLTELIDVSLNNNKLRNIVIDGYIPNLFHNAIQIHLKNKGYFVINLNWETAHPIDRDRFKIELELYQIHLNPELNISNSINGAIDSIRVSTHGNLMITGWAIDQYGEIPSNLILTINGEKCTVIKFLKINRVDIKDIFKIKKYAVGFEILVDYSKNKYGEPNNGLEISLLAGDFNIFTNKFDLF